MVGGVLFTSTAYMAVQATVAMSIIVADVDLGGRDDPGRSLFTLSIVTGAVMIVAGDAATTDRPRTPTGPTAPK